MEAGRSRDDAYRIVQEDAQRAWDEGTQFRDLLAEAAPELDLDAVFDPPAFVRHAPEIVGRLDQLSSVQRQTFRPAPDLDERTTAVPAIDSRPALPRRRWPRTWASRLPPSGKKRDPSARSVTQKPRCTVARKHKVKAKKAKPKARRSGYVLEQRARAPGGR